MARRGLGNSGRGHANKVNMENKIETSVTDTPILSVQQVRLLDVFVVAPFCFYVATFKTLPTAVRAGLAVLGAATLIYNANNYLKNIRNK